MTAVDEIAPDVFRLSTYLAEYRLQMNQFLVRDTESLLFHTGTRALFQDVRDAVSKLIDPKTLRFVGGSHFEMDEYGSANEWLALAPKATLFGGTIGTIVNLGDYAVRAPRGLADGEVLNLGRHRLRYLQTPHVPHGWDSGLLFEENSRTLLCSDLMHQSGNPEAVTQGDVVGRYRETLMQYQAGPLPWYMPVTPQTDHIIERLVALNPARCATMHGSTYEGDCASVLRGCAAVNREVMGGV